MTKNKELYDRIWGRTELSKEYRVGKRTRTRLLLGMINRFRLLPQGGKILDVGCGDGSFLRNFRPGVAYGIDESEEGVKLAASRGIHRDHLSVANIENGKGLPKMKFDLVVCSALLEHIEDDAEALKNIRSLMKKDSHLVIEVPYSMKRWTKFDVQAGHKRRYSEAEIRSKLEGSGFSVVYLRKWGFPLYRVYYSFTQGPAQKRASAERPHLFFIPSCIISSR